MNETVDLREAHRLWMALSTDIHPEHTRFSSIDPQGPCDEIDPMFTPQFKALSTIYHPAIAAVIAHQNMVEIRQRPLVILELVA